MTKESECDNWEGLIDFLLIVVIILLVSWLCLKYFNII